MGQALTPQGRPPDTDHLLVQQSSNLAARTLRALEHTTLSQKISNVRAVMFHISGYYILGQSVIRALVRRGLVAAAVGAVWVYEKMRFYSVGSVQK